MLGSRIDPRTVIFHESIYSPGIPQVLCRSVERLASEAPRHVGIRRKGVAPDPRNLDLDCSFVYRP